MGGASIPLVLGAAFLCVARTASADVAAFTSEAERRGIQYSVQSLFGGGSGHGYGCGFADLDGDGDPDIVALGDPTGVFGLFENVGGSFVDRSRGSGIPALNSVAFATADFDGDGDLDMYIARAGAPSALYRNNGNFHFTDVTAAVGVSSFVGVFPKSPTWGDVDNDGWVDLYVPIYSTYSSQLVPNRLYRNIGGGSFADVAPALGVASLGLTFVGQWSDFDRDGDLDLFLSNDRGAHPVYAENQLFRNDGATFTDVSAAMGVSLGFCSMGLACGDISGDGFPDFYLANVAASLSPPVAGEFPLHLSQPRGPFIESQERWGVGKPHPTAFGWGTTFFDWNNDGRLDLYVNLMLTGQNCLFEQQAAPPMVNVAAAVNALGPSDRDSLSFSAAHADVDGDGDLDLLVSNAGAPLMLLINHEGEKRSWVRFRMSGEWPNTGAIGANVELTAGGATQFRELFAGGNGYLGQQEQVLHFGLGGAETIDAATVRWPSNGPTRSFTSIPAKHLWTLYPPSQLGDADRDGDVDAADLVLLCNALGPVTPGVEMLDFDGDFAITAKDVAAFRAARRGALADLTGDGLVNGSDLAVLLGAWGSTDCVADLNGNGTVGGEDLAVLLGAWSL